MLTFSNLTWGKSQCHELFAFQKVNPPVKIGLIANFYEIQANSNADIFLGKVNDPFLKATLITENGAAILAKARSFGDSSASDIEAPFRKLNIVLDKYYLGAKEFFISTHLHNNPIAKWTPDGRITDGASPYREALAYDIAQTLGIKTGIYLRAQIEYKNSLTGEVFVKPALLVESHKSLAQREGGKLLKPYQFLKYLSDSKKGMPVLDPLEGLKIHMFEAMIGNTDFSLEVYSTGARSTDYYNQLKNINIYQGQTSKFLHPIVFDFDISSLVVGHEVTAASKPWESLPEFTGDIKTAVMLRRLLKIRNIFKESEIKEILKYFYGKKTEIKKMIRDAEVDPGGRAIALDHIEYFFKAADMMWSEEIQFVMQGNVRLYETSAKKGNLLSRNKIEDRAGTLRLGTPFKILGEENGLLKVAIVDIKWDLLEYDRSVGYIQKDILFSNKIPEDIIPFFDVREMFQ